MRRAKEPEYIGRMGAKSIGSEWQDAGGGDERVWRSGVGAAAVVEAMVQMRVSTVLSTVAKWFWKASLQRKWALQVEVAQDRRWINA